MVDVKKFSEIDLYGLIGIEISATEIEVSKIKLNRSGLMFSKINN